MGLRWAGCFAMGVPLLHAGGQPWVLQVAGDGSCQEMQEAGVPAPLRPVHCCPPLAPAEEQSGTCQDSCEVAGPTFQQSYMRTLEMCLQH